MRLVNVYDSDISYDTLYELLEERDGNVNVSHSKMPTWDEHCAFVVSRPYACWYMIEVDGLVTGAVYLTRADEIGVFIFKVHQGNGYGPKAIGRLMDLHPRQHYIANINPGNERSINMFEGMGFSHIQNSYELRP